MTTQKVPLGLAAAKFRITPQAEGSLVLTPEEQAVVRAAAPPRSGQPDYRSLGGNHKAQRDAYADIFNNEVIPGSKGVADLYFQAERDGRMSGRASRSN